MRFISYTKTDAYYEFIDEKGNKSLFPASIVILVDDESNFISVKLISTRKTIGIIPKE